MDAERIAEIFQELARLLSLKGENPFKIRAYETGAEALLDLEEDLPTLIAENRLTSVDGIGEALARKIEELVATGRLELLERLQSEIPDGLLEMLRVPGLGPSRIRRLHQELGVDSLNALETACRDGCVAGLKGFGSKSAESLLRSVERTRRRGEQG